MFERDDATKILTDEQEESDPRAGDADPRRRSAPTCCTSRRARSSPTPGLKVEDERVRWDRGFVMEQVAKAPPSFPSAGAEPRALGP